MSIFKKASKTFKKYLIKQSREDFYYHGKFEARCISIKFIFGLISVDINSCPYTHMRYKFYVSVSLFGSHGIELISTKIESSSPYVRYLYVNGDEINCNEISLNNK